MPDGFTYEGEWTRGEISGQGKATYANGDIYEGLFVQGKRQGAGTMTYATGETASGEWDNGALREDTASIEAASDNATKEETTPAGQ